MFCSKMHDLTSWKFIRVYSLLWSYWPTGPLGLTLSAPPILKQLSLKFKNETLWTQARLHVHAMCLCTHRPVHVWTCLFVCGPVVLSHWWRLSPLRSWAQLDSNRNKEWNIVWNIICHLHHLHLHIQIYLSAVRILPAFLQLVLSLKSPKLTPPFEMLSLET